MSEDVLRETSQGPILLFSKYFGNLLIHTFEQEISTMSTDLESYIQRKIASGDVQSREELTQNALELYRELDEQIELRSELKRRLKEVEAGESSNFNFDDVRKRFLQRVQQANPHAAS